MKSPLFLFLLISGGIFFYAASEPKIWGRFFYPLQYQRDIKINAEKHGLDPNLVAAVIYEESHFNAGQESHAGARGLMQLLPSTAASVARGLGESDYDDSKLLEPDRNIRYGTYYLNYLVDKYQGNLDLALAAYNAGETNVDKWQKEGRVEIPFKETREFVSDVNETKKMYDTVYGEWYKEEDEVLKTEDGTKL